MSPTLLTIAMTLAAEPQGPPIDTSFLRQYAETRGYMLGRPVKPKITPDGKAVLFLRSGPTSPKQSLFEFDVATKQTKELLSPDSLLKGADENLSPEEKARRERQRVSAGGFADFHLDEAGTRVLVSLSGKLFVLDRGMDKTTELKTGPGPCIDPKWSPDGTMVAYVRGQDVYVFHLASGKESAVTTGGTPVITHGLAEFVAQEEMHRHTGYWWSPDSKFIAYEEADHTGVEVWYPSDPAKPDGVPVPQYYPRPGKKNVAVRLGIVPIAGGKTVWVEWDRAKYEYMGNVSWDKWGGLLLILQSRNQNYIELSSVSPVDGKISQVLADLDSTWRHLPSKPPKWLDDNLLLWISDREGDAVLCVIDLGKTGHERQRIISPSGFQVSEVAELFTVSPQTTAPVVIGSSDPSAPGVWQISSINSDRKSAYQHLRPMGPGVATVTSTSDFGTRAYTFTSLGALPTTFVEKESSGSSGRADLPSVALEPPFKPNVVVEKVGDYYTAVVRSRQFDKTKKYPVIVDAYGGPGHLHVVQAMKNWLIPQWLADQGFVVVAIDNRGTPGRGRDWERAVYQKFGTVPLEDQVKGLQALGAKHPELDLARVGIVGWSFGGYMAANAVLRRPDVFHAAVAGAPVTDWEDYDTHYTERYLGLLPESKKAYDEASLIPLAKNLSRPLLLVHGTADDNVFYRHTLKLSDALFRAGKQFEVLPLPGITHMYAADPQVAERLWERNVKFFRQHLGGPK
jgi:dipeptidyl-peptidase-4